jgi:Putative transposase
VFSGSLRPLADRAIFERFLTHAVRQDWIVYAKPPFGGPQQVLKYLARYTHRVAIANSRIVAFDGERVSFRWKDYAAGDRQKTMTLEAGEFMRRFLMHVLPRGFTRIRYFGFLANRHRGQKLIKIRQLLGMPHPHAPPQSPPEAETLSGDEAAGEVCPVCRSGRVHKVATLVPIAPSALSWLLPHHPRASWDTS